MQPQLHIRLVENRTVLRLVMTSSDISRDFQSLTFSCCREIVGIKLLFKTRKLKVLSVKIERNTLSFHIIHSYVLEAPTGRTYHKQQDSSPLK